MTAPGTVVVKIRTIHEDTPRFLTAWPITALDDLLARIKEWGVTTEGGVSIEGASGAFVVGEGSPYFEVVIGDD